MVPNTIPIITTNGNTVIIFLKKNVIKIKCQIMFAYCTNQKGIMFVVGP